MKKIFYLLFLFTSLSIFGQEFSFSMYFEDAVGNKDTLVLGYDPAATEGLNLQFGEENILYEPYIKDLDVRTGIFKMGYWQRPDSFLTKKHIAPKTCFTEKFPLPENIYIYCKNFPLRVSWDPVFNDDCNKYSFIVDWDTGGWFDAIYGGEQGPFFMKDSSSITFDHLNVYGSHEWLIPFNEVNLNVLYYSFWFYHYLYIEEILPEKILIYPNPVKDILYINPGNSEFESALIRDLSGQILISANAHPIQVSTLQEGVYLLEMKIRNSPNVFVQKFNKSN